MMLESPAIPRANRAFSLVEVLVALVLAGAVLVTVVTVFGTLVSGPRASPGRESVAIGASAMQELFGMEAAAISVATAPSYGSRALADQMRAMFWDDVAHANAVFCLGRQARNSLRPLSIPFLESGRLVDSPERFREVLLKAFPTEASIFTSYRHVSTATNGSIFVLEPSEESTHLAVRAIYEIDFVQTSDPPGVYAVVQRYGMEDNVAPPAMGRLAFYDVFYPDSTVPIENDFSPLFVFFERKALRAVEEGAAIDAFKVAEAMPFYLIWWPDPTAASLRATIAASANAADPKSKYGAMGGMTSYFFAVPMMPPL